MTDLRARDPVTSTRYQVAVHALAATIAAELEAEGLTGDAAWDRAEAAFAHHRASSPHAWLFQGIESLLASPSVFEALEPRADGTRGWLQASVESAAAAVVKFDVFQRLGELREMEIE